MQANEEAKPKDYIEVSEQWWEKLNAVPFVSCKYCAGALTLFTTYLTLFLFLYRTQGKDFATSQAGFEASAPDTQTHQTKYL